MLLGVEAAQGDLEQTVGETPDIISQIAYDPHRSARAADAHTAGELLALVRRLRQSD
ncbi:MAG TPA: hypothetical protein VK674_00325 [Candidatus Limnocylindria bacterium]|nr:hypothetical protein [Candidatus Limnocylindria bacterium]